MPIKFLLNGKTIDLTADETTIDSDNFSVDKTGKVKATSGEIGGFDMTADSFSSKIYSEYDFTEEDLIKIRNYMMETGTLTEDELALYDVYKDGVVDARDYMLISHYIASGITKELPGKVTLTNGDVFNTFTIKDGIGEDLVNLNAFESKIKSLKVENLNVNGIDVTTDNKVLWEGAMYMNENQVANLSDLVSNQNNGIVLVWSAYRNDVADSSNWTYCFIPKQHVRYGDGNGVDMQMSGTAFSNMCCKYVYVHDTYIGGHATNNTSGTNNGITYTNNAFVLRYVLGV